MAFILDPNSLIIIKLPKDVILTKANNSYRNLLPFLNVINRSQNFEVFDQNQMKLLIGDKLD